MTLLSQQPLWSESLASEAKEANHASGDWDPWPHAFPSWRVSLAPHRYRAVPTIKQDSYGFSWSSALVCLSSLPFIILYHKLNKLNYSSYSPDVTSFFLVGGSSFSGSCFHLCLDCLSLSQLQKSQVLFISYGLWTLSYFSKDMPLFKVFTPLCFIIRLFTFVISPSWLSGKESIHLLMQETQEMWVRFLGQEGPLRRKWQPIPVFLSGKFHGQRSPEGCKELDAAEHTHTHTLKERSSAYLSSCAGLRSALFLQGFCD